MTRLDVNEISEHDQLILMMARYFKQQGYTDIKADITGWPKPTAIYWTNNPDNKYYPDLTCVDLQGHGLILEAETCSTLNIQHTRDQFQIFRAHASSIGGKFDVVIPRICSGIDTRQQIRDIASGWGITLDSVWVPSN